jgi:phenylalanyl-tRNA synthetase beta chain
MKVSLQWLNKYTELPLHNQEELNAVVDKIALQIVDVDERWLEKDKAVIDVDNKIITNRAYMFGHRGFAREVAIMLDQEWSGGKYPSLPAKATELPLEVKVEAPELCPRYTAVIIKGVKIGPSPEHLKKYLESIGIRSINNIVDITNFIMSDTGQPVHAFDYNFVKDKKIIVRRAYQEEKLTTLDGVTRDLHPEDLVIADAERAIGIGGVMGGGNSEISEDTTDIVLEVASFHPIHIRQTAKYHKLRTEAAMRFEKGPDPSNIPHVMALLVHMIQESAGGEVASDFIDINNLKESTVRYEPFELTFNASRINKLLGYDIDQKHVFQILSGFGIEVNLDDKDVWKLSIPSYRSDIKFAADVIEDIGRMYGYENIPNRPPVNQVVIPGINKKVEVTQKIRNTLTGSGLDEVITYPFIPEEDKQNFNLKGLIPILNPQTTDYKYLRSTLLPSLTHVVALNAKYFEEFGIFELARTFLRPNNVDSEDFITEQPREVETVTAMYYSQKEKEQSIFKLKGAVENVMTTLHIQNFSFTPDGEINIGNEKVGKIGLVDAKALHNNGIEIPVSYVELDLLPLLDHYVDVVQFKPVSKYPGTRLEYSVIIPSDQPIASIYQAIPTHQLIVDIQIKDIYRNLKEAGKKSVLIAVYIQSSDKNITASDAYDIGKWIETKLTSIPQLELRGSVQKPADYKPTDLHLE